MTRSGAHSPHVHAAPLHWHERLLDRPLTGHKAPLAGASLSGFFGSRAPHHHNTRAIVAGPRARSSSLTASSPMSCAPFKCRRAMRRLARRRLRAAGGVRHQRLGVRPGPGSGCTALYADRGQRPRRPRSPPDAPEPRPRQASGAGCQWTYSSPWGEASGHAPHASTPGAPSRHLPARRPARTASTCPWRGASSTNST